MPLTHSHPASLPPSSAQASSVACCSISLKSGLIPEIGSPGVTSFQPGDLWIKGKTSLPCVPGLPLTHPADCGNRDRHACAEWEGHRSRWPWQLRDEAPVLLRGTPSPPWLCRSAPGPAPISPFAMKGTQVRSSIVSWPVESQGSKGLSCHIACPFQPKLAVFLPM